MTRILATIALVTPLLLLTNAAPEAQQKIRFSNSTRVNPVENLPALAATEQGFWKKEGVDVDWFLFKSGGEHMRGVAAAGTKMGMTGAVTLMVPMSRGVPILFIADTRASQDFYLWVRAADPVKEAKQLAGKKIGISRTGSLSHAYSQVTFKALGMEQQVKFVATGGIVEAMAALKAGSVDAIIFTQMSMAIPKHEGVIREILNSRDFLPKPWMDLGVFAQKELITTQPATVKKVLNGFLKGTEFAMTNRSWSIEKMKKEFFYPEAVAHDIFDLAIKYDPRGKIDPKALETVRSFMIEYRLLPKDAPPGVTMYTDQFVE